MAYRLPSIKTLEQARARRLRRDRSMRLHALAARTAKAHEREQARKANLHALFEQRLAVIVKAATKKPRRVSGPGVAPNNPMPQQ